MLKEGTWKVASKMLRRFCPRDAYSLVAQRATCGFKGKDSRMTYDMLGVCHVQGGYFQEPVDPRF